MVPEFVARTGGSKWVSALPTGSKWLSALPTVASGCRLSLPRYARSASSASTVSVRRAESGPSSRR